MLAISPIATARKRLIDDGLPADRELLTAIARLPEEATLELLALADDVRAKYCGDHVSLEILFNAKRGACPENCQFCSQSAQFETTIEATPLASVEEFLTAARAAHARGGTEFCIVIAMRSPSASVLRQLCDAVRAIKAELPLTVAGSFGLLRDSDVAQLAEAGVTRINHNIETARRFFPRICSTHSFDDRIATCKRIVAHGLDLCCGGIIGMGESKDDRIDFLMDLAALEPQEVPINFLDPRPGTPMSARELLAPMEALQFVAWARLALPRACIRFAGGRETVLRDWQEIGMRSGANGLVLGDYLTTPGRNDGEDFAMLKRLGYQF